MKFDIAVLPEPKRKDQEATLKVRIQVDQYHDLVLEVETDKGAWVAVAWITVAGSVKVSRYNIDEANLDFEGVA